MSKLVLSLLSPPISKLSVPVYANECWNLMVSKDGIVFLLELVLTSFRSREVSSGDRTRVLSKRSKCS